MRRYYDHCILQCDPGVAIKALHDHIVTPPTKLMIIGGGCSIATAPVARAAPHFGLVQVILLISTTLSHQCIFSEKYTN